MNKHSIEGGGYVKGSRRTRLIWLGAMSLGVLAVFVQAAMGGDAPEPNVPPSASLDLLALISGLLGGLSLFLYGLDRMAETLKQVAGERMKIILAKLTSNRFVGMITGTIVTAILQSSSVTTVLVVGFVSAGAMSLPQAMGVILGADIGTTITAQLIAFNVTRYALAVIALGFGVSFFARRKSIRVHGTFIMGLGLIFYGMGLMSGSMAPMRHSPFFIDLMAALENPAAAILTAAAFTALIQASAATIGIVIVLASQGLVTLETGIALSLGANIGTCATAGLAAIGKTREAVQAALAHVLFKVAGVLLVYPFIPELAEVVVWMTPAASTGLDAQAGDGMGIIPRQIANAHTLFNIGIAFLFLPFATLFARFLQWLIPPSEHDGLEQGIPIHLDASMLQVPSVAIQQVRLEAGRMGILVERMFKEGSLAAYRSDLEAMHRVHLMDDAVDRLYEAMASYLARISAAEISEQQSNTVLKSMSAIGNLESIGDIVETNLYHVVGTAASQNVRLSKSEIEDLERVRHRVAESLHKAIQAFVEDSPEIAYEVESMKNWVMELDEEIKRRNLARLREEGERETPASKLRLSILEYDKRIYHLTKRVAKRVLQCHPEWKKDSDRAKAGDGGNRKRKKNERAHQEVGDPNAFDAADVLNDQNQHGPDTGHHHEGGDGS